MSKPEKFNHLL